MVRKRCAAEIMDDFIPECRQDGDMFVGERESILLKQYHLPYSPKFPSLQNVKIYAGGKS